MDKATVIKAMVKLYDCPLAPGKFLVSGVWAFYASHSLVFVSKFPFSCLKVKLHPP